MDPLFEKAPHLMPYHYVSNNPIMRIDPDGLTDYITDSDGNITVREENDNETDVLFDKDGVRIGEVNKGFLSENIKKREKGLLIDVKSKEDFSSYLSFTLELSVYENKEIGGFIIDSESGSDDIYITLYKESLPAKAIGFKNFVESKLYDISNKEINLNGVKFKSNAWFHKHPDVMSANFGSSKPSDSDLNTTKTLGILGLILGGWGGMALMNIDKKYERWGN